MHIFAERLFKPGTGTLLLWSAALMILSGISGASELKPSMPAEKLIEAMNEGGYVIYLRHEVTNHDQTDQPTTDFKDCSKQRNLSEEGKRNARELGANIVALNIPIGDVLSSPYCRCIDTAKLAFNKAEVLDALASLLTQDANSTAALAKRLNELLATVPAPHTNTVLVSHTANIKSAVGLWPKAEGIAMVFKPHGDGTSEYLGEILREEWKQALGHAD